jgi:hypothetical protein
MSMRNRIISMNKKKRREKRKNKMIDRTAVDCSPALEKGKSPFLFPFRRE